MIAGVLMTLSVIGSGFGRTGTMSLKIALEKLGLGPCHHMEEVMEHPEQLDHWCAAAKGEPVDWDKVYSGYRSTVDWPGARFWRDLANAYPDAKIIHTTRPAQSWWESYSRTIATIMDATRTRGVNDEIKTIQDMAYAIVAEQTFGGSHDDKEVVVKAFETHADDLISSIAAERLLVFNVSEGWQPLCDFLELPVPDEPFPRSNDQDAFTAQFGSLAEISSGP
jgi:hypothetical protein